MLAGDFTLLLGILLISLVVLITHFVWMLTNTWGC